ncbi:MAG: hypothetical protein U1E76_11915 [Planctomycetota bacterium]
MDATAKSLIDAILADPEADAPRTALASRLEALSDPRGTFIRLQMIAARSPDTGERNRARREADGLLAKHRALWARDIDGRVPFAKFLRGFVELIHIDGVEAARSLADLYEVAPIRMLVVTDPARAIDALARSPQLDRIVKLSLPKGGLSDAQATQLLSSPHVRRLKAIDLSFNDLGPAVLDALCNRSHLPALVYANVIGNRFDDPVEQAGADPTTAELDLSSVSLPALGLALEAKYGLQPWLHAPTGLRTFPPRDEHL